MYQLTINAALAYVRKAMDELMSVEEKDMLTSPDALDLQKLVEASIVEAAVRTHALAPAIMLDGEIATLGTDYNVTVTGDGVASIVFLTKTARVISLQASDSGIVVSSMVPEDSAEGRKQLNKYVRGVPDDPRVVLEKVWAGDHKPNLKYYTTATDGTATFTIEHYPYPAITGGTTEVVPEGGEVMPIDVSLNPGVTEEHIEICPRMKYAVLNELTAMILESLNEHERASLYRTKAKEYMGG